MENKDELLGEDIPKSFRFIVEAKDFPNIKWMVKSVEVNYLDRDIYLTLYECSEGRAYEYLMSLRDLARKKEDNELLLTSLGANGRKLFTLQFQGVTGCEHSLKYDYDSKNPLTHTVRLDYVSVKRLNYKH